MRRLPSALVASIGLTLAPGFATHAVASHGSSGAGAACQWATVASPHIGSTGGHLSGVSAVSATDAWAVGSTEKAPTQPLIEHWDGSAWSVVAGLPDASGGTLLAVDALTSTDTWAVGLQAFVGQIRTLAMHWNGSSWLVVDTPDPGAEGNTLRGVAIVASNDVWAVGGFSGSGARGALFEHWNGASWEVVHSPNVVHGGPAAVSAVSATDVWAVGEVNDGTTTQPLFEHWNGSRWRVVASPPVQGEVYLNGVSARTSGDVWAVGHVGYAPITMHWNGRRWSVIPSPARGANLDFLEGVSAVSAKDVRAVGYRHHPSTPLVMQWNGSVWSVVSAHFPGKHAGLAGVDQVPGTKTVWGVGNQVAAPLMYGQPLIERSC